MNTAQQTEALAVITIAQSHMTLDTGSISSAMVCLEDARKLFARGDFSYARVRALRSLAYSVGILSEVYQTANGGKHVQLGYQVD